VDFLAAQQERSAPSGAVVERSHISNGQELCWINAYDGTIRWQMVQDSLDEIVFWCSDEGDHVVVKKQQRKRLALSLPASPSYYQLQIGPGSPSMWHWSFE
jgi:hypothetical protein